MDLYEGIYLRKSIRTYQMEKLDDKILENLQSFTNHLKMLDDNQKVQFEIVEGSEKTKAPYYLVLSALAVEGYELNAGFLMQQIMLYIMTKGLGSCFMQYHNLPISKIEGFEPVIMLAFGKTDQNLCREAAKAKRLKLKDICSFKNLVNEDIKRILNAGRLAPSSFNSQPWRFVAYENRIHLFCRKIKLPIRRNKRLKMQRVDVGIALANMYLAAEELWFYSEIVKVENIKEHSFKSNEYLVSIIFQK